MIKLTARQQQVLDFIRSALEETGFPPTRAEIAAELGFKSPNAAEEHLKALARKGAARVNSRAHSSHLPFLDCVSGGARACRR